MCKCRNGIEFGSYETSVHIYIPEQGHTMSSCINNRVAAGLNETRTIAIDECMMQDILFLWGKGIRTAGCCCGHNRIPSMINILDVCDYNKMLGIGYIQNHDLDGVEFGRTDTFFGMFV